MNLAEYSRTLPQLMASTKSDLVGRDEQWLLIRNPYEVELTVTAESCRRLLVLRCATSGKLILRLERGASLTLVELFEQGAKGETLVEQAEGAHLKATALELGSAEAAYTVDLKGAHASSELNAIFTVGGAEQSRLAIRTNHLVPDCTSQSVVRGLAGGTAVGRFEGMVYVAPDAQRTDAQQQNRNMLLSDTARIDTLPQLEIYADDVKCTHGATVGQMDQEAIYYMRQRGIDELQARRLQIAGFVGDLVMQCGCEELCTALLEQLNERLDTL